MQKIGDLLPQIIKSSNTTRVSTKKNTSLPSIITFQHNNLIEAKYSLTLQEKKIILWLTSQIKRDDSNFKEHTLKVKDFMNLLGVTGNPKYSDLQRITLGLMKKALIIKEPEKKITIQVSWLDFAKYEEGEGLIKLSFSSKMHPFLLNLKETFTTINLRDLMQFKSIHSIRIYELLKQYRDIGERTLSLEEIRECCGVSKKLLNYSDFERKVVLISQKEINEKSDIRFKFERIKHVRKIVAIKFIISNNKAYELHNNPPKEICDIKRKPPVVYSLKEFGLSARIVNQIMKENTEQEIQDAIDAVDLQLSRGKVRNAKAMLMVAIKEKWHPERYKVR